MAAFSDGVMPNWGMYVAETVATKRRTTRALILINFFSTGTEVVHIKFLKKTYDLHVVGFRF